MADSVPWVLHSNGKVAWLSEGLRRGKESSKMKTQKTNGKIGFELCIQVDGFLTQTLGKDYRRADLVQACESNLNNFHVVGTPEIKASAVTARPKAGLATMAVQTNEKREGKLDVVNSFLGWHDNVEKLASKAGKIGAMVTVTALPEVNTFGDWIEGFKVKAEKKETVKAVKA
jgi:hypothetical protein